MIVVTALLAPVLGALWLTLFVAVRRRDVAAAVNASGATALALGSVALTLWLDVSSGALACWVAVAGLLHSFGMLGPYDSIWWWDHLTHTVSAALVAALVHAALLAAVRVGLLSLSPAAVSVAVLASVLIFGVFWELIEQVARAVGERYEIEPVLVYYGWRDTALDLGFDVVGAVLVVALDVRLFVDLAARFPETTFRALTWTVGIAVGGSVLLVLVLVVDDQHAA